MKASTTMTSRRRRRKLLPSEIAGIIGIPPSSDKLSAVIPIQHEAQRKKCHPKIEQLKNCQLKIHALEVFAVFILSIPSLSEECGKIGLSRISQINGRRRSV